jgi:hypothetical protein
MIDEIIATLEYKIKYQSYLVDFENCK